MCGRFTLRTNPSDLVEIFSLLRKPELTPRFNIAPTSRVAVVRTTGRDRELFQMRWGLVPSWSKDPKNEDVAALPELLQPYPAEEMTAFPIGTRSSGIDSPVVRSARDRCPKAEGRALP